VEIIVINMLILGNHIPMLSFINNYADSSRVAMDKIGVVSYLLGDHLGSMSADGDWRGCVGFRSPIKRNTSSIVVV
jgi:hypothetical protein